MMTSEALRDVKRAVAALQAKEDIKAGDKVVDRACPVGRVNRTINMIRDLDESDPKRDKKIEVLNKRLSEFESRLAELQAKAEKTIRAYVEICKFSGEQPEKFGIKPCNCGHCDGYSVRSLDALWAAEHQFRIAVFDIFDGDEPDLSKEAIEKVRDVWDTYNTIATAMDEKIDLQYTFYGGW